MAQRTQYTVEKHNTIRNFFKKRLSTERLCDDKAKTESGNLNAVMKIIPFLV